MGRQHEYDMYTRDGCSVSISLRDRESRLSDGNKRKIRNTLDCLPIAHLNLFGENGHIEGKNIIGAHGNEVRGGGNNPNIPFINLSYACFDSPFNSRGHLLYTLLHEMGHVVDKSINPTCMRVLSRNFTRGYIAMLSRYHGGGTQGHSEHYADIYADYFFNEIGEIRYNVNINDRANLQNISTKCGGGGGERSGCIGRHSCNSWLGRRRREQLLSSLRSLRLEELTALRYDALFRSSPFDGLTRRGTHQTTQSVDVETFSQENEGVEQLRLELVNRSFENYRLNSGMQLRIPGPNGLNIEVSTQAVEHMLWQEIYQQRRGVLRGLLRLRGGPLGM